MDELEHSSLANQATSSASTAEEKAARRTADFQGLLPIFDTTTVFLGLLETDGTLVRVNAAALQAVKVTQESVINRPFWLGPWWTHDVAQQEMLQTAIMRASRGETVGFEATHPKPDGSLIYVDFVIRPIRAEDGQIVWLLPEGCDVTARKVAEKKLQSERAILRTVIDSIPDLIFYKDTGSVYLGCNKAFEKYFGKPESQIVGRTDYYFVDTETATSFRSKDQQTMSQSEPIRNEEWVRYPDGQRVLLETLKAPIRGSDNKVVGILGVSRDITQNRQAEVALRISDTRYRQLFDNMTSGFALHEIILDPIGKPLDYRFLQVNPAFEQLIGFSAEQLIGRSVREVLPDIEDYWIEVYGSVALTGKAVARESFAAGLGRWYSVRAFCPQPGQFATIVNDVTERRISDVELHRQKAQLRAILDNFPFIVWLKDREGRYLDANVEMARLCGLQSPEEMTGKRDEDFWPPEIAAAYRANDQLVMDVLERRTMEELSGDTGRWVETFKTPILDEDGALLGTAGFARDITERRQAEEALRTSQAHYQALLEASPVGVFEMDFAGTCVYVNQKYVEITGMTFEMAKGHGWTKGVYPEDLTKLMQLKSMALGQHKMQDSMEYRHIRPDGKLVWVMGHAAFMEAADRQMSGVMVTLTDITERKEMETRLRLSASMFEASSEGIMVVDADNRIVSVNPAFTALLGYETAEVLGRDPGEFGAARNMPSFYQSLWHSVDATGHWQGEIWNRSKDGREIALWMSINTLRNRKGGVQWRFAMFSDVTERKRAEETIWRQANYDTLTGLPNRRLFRDRLQQEIKKADRSGRKLALFFIDLDHFKEVNDTFGHDCGDSLLMEAGERIRHCLRDSDTVARMGGDEFTAILPELMDEQRVDAVAQSILQTLATPFVVEGQHAHISASIGVAMYPQDGDSDVVLLKQADRAMYFAKAKGKNCFSKLNG